jgi:mRNA interferase MazF
MVRKTYIPRRGDIVWLNFTPQKGHEQRGKRPAIVLSPETYNSKVGLAVFCPITSKAKGYPFEVQITSKKIGGSILSDQVKSLDWTSREIKFIERADKEVLSEVLAKLNTLVSE